MPVRGYFACASSGDRHRVSIHLCISRGEGRGAFRGRPGLRRVARTPVTANAALLPGGFVGFRRAPLMRSRKQAQRALLEPSSCFSRSGVKGWERLLDPDVVLRCTIQHYLVTDEGSLADADVAGVRRTVDAVYAQADRTGSTGVDADASTRSTAQRQSFSCLR